MAGQHRHCATYDGAYLHAKNANLVSAEASPCSYKRICVSQLHPKAGPNDDSLGLNKGAIIGLKLSDVKFDSGWGTM